MAIAQAEDNPRNPVTVEVAAYFPKAVAKGSAVWAAKGPTKFDFLNVLADRKPVRIRQLKDPFTNGPAPTAAFIKPRGQFFRAIDHQCKCAKIGTSRQETLLNWRLLASDI